MRQLPHFAKLASIVFAFSLILQAPFAHAQRLSGIRDTEIEKLLADYAQPILRAAGLGGDRVRIRIINSPEFNAFVLDGRNIFMNAGTLLKSETPNEVIGVIAHEAGHIAGGHLTGLRARIRQDQTKALLIQILGIGAMIAGAASGGDAGKAVGGAGQSVLSGGNYALTRSLLTYRRGQEASADQAGAEYLRQTKQSARGMIATFERFASQELFTASQQDQYVRSHPMARTRIANLRRIARRSPFFDRKDPPKLQLRHDLMRAKLIAFMNKRQPIATFQVYPKSDQSLAARYARAIAIRFSRGVDAFLPQIDALIRENPSYPYFHELKGQFLFESGRPREAVAPYRKALKLAGRNADLIKIRLAMSLLNSNERANADRAISLLRQALVSEKSGIAYRNLARAYGAKRDIGRANLATAEGYFYEGRIKQAQAFARRAVPKFKRGSAQWVKANDIINFRKTGG